MQVLATDFIKSPASYLDKARDSIVMIVEDGKTIAVLSKPSNAPLTDSLLGIMKDYGIETRDDIRDMYCMEHGA